MSGGKSRISCNENKSVYKLDPRSLEIYSSLRQGGQTRHVTCIFDGLRSAPLVYITKLEQKMEGRKVVDLAFFKAKNSNRVASPLLFYFYFLFFKENKRQFLPAISGSSPAWLPQKLSLEIILGRTDLCCEQDCERNFKRNPGIAAFKSLGENLDALGKGARSHQVEGGRAVGFLSVPLDVRKRFFGAS